MKFILQHDSMQCGIACLKMICQNFGKEVSFSFLSNMCSCTNEGTSLLSISETAKKIGLKSICCKLSLSDLSDVQTSCILYWNQNHFVVLYKVSKGKLQSCSCNKYHAKSAKAQSFFSARRV